MDCQHDTVLAYPRMPHLVHPPGGARDDLVLSTEILAEFLRSQVRVEEKLDGANVSISLEGGVPVGRSRSGATGRDRARQLGRLKAWISERSDALRRLLRRGEVLYGEWLYRVHSVHYDQLPDLLAVLDLWTSDGGFASSPEREARCATVGLVTPPLLFEGVLRTVETVARLCGKSRWGGESSEGVVVRLEIPGRPPARAKFLAPRFHRKSDAEWAAEVPRFHRVARGSASS